MTYNIDRNSLEKNEYWDERYFSGGTSGEGSIGKSRDFKWDVITQYVPQIDDVLDIACGDLSFWEGRDCKHYTGVDLSPTIVEKNKKSRPHWNFIVGNAADDLNESAEIVFCNDVLFHIMDGTIFETILQNLCKFSKQYIFIFTWSRNPFTILKYKLNLIRSMQLRLFLRILSDNTTDGKYQKYRDFSKYYSIFEESGFELVNVHPAPIKPYTGAMYVFRKK